MIKNKLWLPLEVATRVRYNGAGMMGKNNKRRAIILHNEGRDRPESERKGDVTWLAEYVVRARKPYHAIWNPTTGQWIQMIAFDRSASSLVVDPIGEGLSGNRWGSVAIQICISGFGYKPFTSLKKLKGVNVLADIAASWGVPLEGREEWGSRANRGLDGWRANGFHGHCHAPGRSETHVDPGPIDWPKLRRALV